MSHVSQSTSGRYIGFHVVRVSLNNTHVLYIIRLDFERRVIIYVWVSICPFICLSVGF